MGQEYLTSKPSTSVEILPPFAIPEAFDAIPSGHTLINRLARFVRPDLSSSEIQIHDLEILRLQADYFQKSSNIILNFADFGLGDAVFQLAYAQALAREYDQVDSRGKYLKNFIVLVPQAIKDIKALNLPRNVHLYPNVDEAIESHSEITSGNTMIIQLLRGPIEAFIELNRSTHRPQTDSFVIPRKKSEDVAKSSQTDLLLDVLKHNNKWVLPLDSRFSRTYALPYDDFIAFLVESTQLRNYSDLDLSFIIQLKLLGATVATRNISSPILDIQIINQLKNSYLEGGFLKRKTGYDLVIALDAGESSKLDTQEDYQRSLKSPRAQNIEQAFQSLVVSGPDFKYRKIAFLPGKKHTKYSQDVFTRLHNFLPNIQYVPTESFDEMLGLFAASKVIFTSDSVTRWIAEALIRTELKQDPQTQHTRLVTLHNGVLIPYQLYGPRINPAVCIGLMPLDPENQRYELCDLDIPYHLIARELEKALKHH